uniref:Leucine rich repeat containing 58 n=1 Tax=Equus asinus TaxID=9793 RepID=A0A9L0JYB2_EQUAS
HANPQGQTAKQSSGSFTEAALDSVDKSTASRDYQRGRPNRTGVRGPQEGLRCAPPPAAPLRAARHVPRGAEPGPRAARAPRRLASRALAAPRGEQPPRHFRRRPPFRFRGAAELRACRARGAVGSTAPRARRRPGWRRPWAAVAAAGEAELNLSRLSVPAETLEAELEARAEERRGAREALLRLLLPHSRLASLPRALGSGFPHLQLLDVSGNALTALGPELLALRSLRTLLAKNNRLGGPGALPKGLARSPLCRSLQVLNLSGNCFQEVPASLLELRALQTLCLGGNQLQSIPAEIENLRSLECLYLGGNFIKEIPPELANLPSLKYLVLCDNKIQSVPPQLSQLHSLRSLSLHNNLLTYLPREILNLIHLEELSLRGNPLVVRFVRDLTYDPPTLLELAARTIKIRNIPYTPYDLPGNLLRYLSLASNCPNPKCGGVYFDCCVRQIKFVDFCGKYRLPLMHYLCSPECSSPCSSVSHSSTSQSESDSEDEAGVAAHRMQKVLLG